MAGHMYAQLYMACSQQLPIRCMPGKGVCIVPTHSAVQLPPDMENEPHQFTRLLRLLL
jgi:hypothetical protein